MFCHDRFIFNNVDSMGMNVGIIWDKKGLQSQSMFKKTINEDKNTVHSIDISNQEIKVKIALFDDSFTNIEPMTISKRREIVDWLCRDYYLPFQSFENQSIFYYVMFSESTRNYIPVNEKGYLELTMKCDSAYCASHFDIYNIVVDGEESVRLPNKGDVTTKPIIELLALEDGEVEIKNRSNGQVVKIINLTEEEVVDIDCTGMYIKSNIVRNKYKDFNRVFLEFPRGINLLEIKGHCKIKIKYQHHFLI